MSEGVRMRERIIRRAALEFKDRMYGMCLRAKDQQVSIPVDCFPSQPGDWYADVG